MVSLDYASSSMDTILGIERFPLLGDTPNTKNLRIPRFNVYLRIFFFPSEKHLTQIINVIFASK